MRLVWWSAGIVLVLDQITKFLVVHSMRLDQRLAIDVLPPYFNLRMAWNRGVNFGLMQGESDFGRWLLVALAIGISLWVAIWISRRDAGPMARLCAGILIGGAIGNVIDRLIYGAVADFINMSCCGIANPWAFNVADIAIFAGAIGLVLFTGERSPRQDKRKQGS